MARAASPASLRAGAIAMSVATAATTTGQRATWRGVTRVSAMDAGRAYACDDDHMAAGAPLLYNTEPFRIETGRRITA